MLKIDQQELDRCAKYLAMPDHSWGKVQNDANDKETGFIYFCDRMSQVLDLCIANDSPFDYALHRWFNFHTSKQVENIFCELGATHEQNEKNHDIDIYFNDTPYDIKLSVMPSAFKGKPLATRAERNELINWLINNASKEGRHQNANRLYIVCDAETQEQMLLLKGNYDKIKAQCQKFVDYYKSHPLNKIGDKFYDIIVIR